MTDDRDDNVRDINELLQRGFEERLALALLDALDQLPEPHRTWVADALDRGMIPEPVQEGDTQVITIAGVRIAVKVEPSSSRPTAPPTFRIDLEER